MGTFVDAFDRSDRLLAGDNGWLGVGGNVLYIVSGHVEYTGDISGAGTPGTTGFWNDAVGVIRQTSAPAGVWDVSVVATGAGNDGYDADMGIVLAVNNVDFSEGINVSFGSDGFCTIREWYPYPEGSTNGGASDFLKSFSVAGLYNTGTATYRVTYDPATKLISVYVNGTLASTATGTLTHNGTYCGFGGTFRYGDEFLFDNFTQAWPDPPVSAGITQAFVDLLKPTIPNLWGGLLAQNPRTVQDPLTVELLGQAYSRPEAYVNGFFRDMLFPAIGKGATVAALGLFDAEVNGDLRYTYVFDDPLVFSNGGYLYIPDTSLALGWGEVEAQPDPADIVTSTQRWLSNPSGDTSSNADYTYQGVTYTYSISRGSYDGTAATGTVAMTADRAMYFEWEANGGARYGMTYVPEGGGTIIMDAADVGNVGTKYVWALSTGGVSMDRWQF